jgi:hypothetical protein
MTKITLYSLTMLLIGATTFAQEKITKENKNKF